MSNQENQNNLPPVVTVESLTESHGDEAEKLYHRIADIGGFGDFSRGDYYGGHPPLALAGLKPKAIAAIAEAVAKKPETPPHPALLNKIPAVNSSANDKKEGND